MQNVKLKMQNEDKLAPPFTFYILHFPPCHVPRHSVHGLDVYRDSAGPGWPLRVAVGNGRCIAGHA